MSPLSSPHRTVVAQIMTPLTMTFLHLIVISLSLSLVTAHSFLTEPDAYFRRFQLRDCRGKECQQACPTFPVSPSNMRNTQARPARTWRRGQTVTIRWARNNHSNGFIRFSIVPVNVMMKRKWHTRLALYTGCFVQGPFRCRGERLCGADFSKTGYHRRLTIPAIYPDGDYVLGMVWFGGARHPINQAPKFSDYFSCSYIRIKGGKPLGGRAQHFYEPGDVLKTKGFEEGKCFAAIDAPGVCSKFGCRSKADWKIPRGFKPAGRQPARINLADVVAARKS